jgi:adenylate cyclase
MCYCRPPTAGRRWRVDGRILIDGRVQVAVESIASLEPLGELDLKGLHRPVRAFNVRDLTA